MRTRTHPKTSKRRKKENTMMQSTLDRQDSSFLESVSIDDDINSSFDELESYLPSVMMPDVEQGLQAEQTASKNAGVSRFQPKPPRLFVGQDDASILESVYVEDDINSSSCDRKRVPKAVVVPEQSIPPGQKAPKAGMRSQSRQRRKRLILAGGVALLLVTIVVVSIVVATTGSSSDDNNNTTLTVRPSTPEPTTLTPTEPPISEEPATLSPTEKPTTTEPTSLTPTTPPSTAEPSTVVPTTLEPTTQQPATPSPTIPLTTAIPFLHDPEEIKQVLFQFALYSGVALSDETSPQYQAVLWLAQDPNYESYPVAKVVQRHALATLFYSTSGPEWNTASFNRKLEEGWLSGEDECAWYTSAPDPASICDNDGNIVELSLDGNNLSGPLPPEIALLSHLQVLNLTNNAISGPIPPELGLLSSLVHLDLSSNSLSLALPPELGQLAKLQTLNLSSNGLSGDIPGDFSNLSKLKTLILHGNELDGSVPDGICDLKTLERIEVDCERVTCNCCGAFCLKPLLVSVSPDSGAALQDEKSPQYLAYTWLSNDRNLDEYSKERIVQRYVYAVLFYSTGGSHWRFKRGWLSNSHECRWRGVDSNECNDGALVEFKMSQNNATGPIPPEISLLSNTLVLLDLSENSLSGNLPSELGLLTELKYLDLSSNKLSGPIPGELANLERLEQLFLDENNLGGSIPGAMCSRASLETIQVDCDEVTCSCCDNC